jgi:hypothetical protein
MSSIGRCWGGSVFGGGQGDNPRREEGLKAARATMAEIFDGAPEFVDLIVVDEVSP